MEELAFVSIKTTEMPKNNTSLMETLIKAGLNGQYTEKDSFLYLKNEAGEYEFAIYEPHPDEIEEGFEEGFAPGVSICGTFKDPVGELLNLEPIFKKAFPSSEFSTAFDD